MKKKINEGKLSELKDSELEAFFYNIESPDEFINNVKELIDDGGDVNRESFLLRIVTRKYRSNKDWMKAIKFLLDNGADPSARRYVAVKWAAEWGYADLLKMYLDIIKDHLYDEDPGNPGTVLDTLKHWAKASDKCTKQQTDQVLNVFNQY